MVKPIRRFPIAIAAAASMMTQVSIASGVDLAKNFPEGGFSVSIGDATAVGFGLSQFGYMDIVLTGGGDWTGRMLDRKGNALAQCDSSSTSGTGDCSPTED